MSSWFKAAEDLFEVVDRRAKLVVSELADEQSDDQPSASNGQLSQGKKKKSQKKAQRRLSSKDELSKTNDVVQEETSTLIPHTDTIPNKDENDSSLETAPTNTISMEQTNTEQQGSVDKDISITVGPSSEILQNEVVENQPDVEGPPTEADSVNLNSNGELVEKNAFDSHDDPRDLPLRKTQDNVDNGDHFVEAATAHNDPLDIDKGKSHSLSDDSSTSFVTQSKHSALKDEPLLDDKKNQEYKVVTSSPKKVQEQLEEAQGLLQSTKTTGQSKEARLARVCAGLSSRLQEYKSENSQLEELLAAERELSKSYQARIKQLQQDLSVSKMELSKVESNMAGALASKNSEIEALSSSVDALKKQAALSQGNLASLQANMESVMRNRELTETRMMQALREELATLERRAEEERAAHKATKMAAMEREVELEHRAVDASTALVRVQRVAEERMSKAAELEQKVALLEVECASLNQELQDTEARVRRGQKKPEEANQVIQMQAWQEEIERARQGQRDAESKVSSLEAEVQKMRVEISAMKRDAEHYSRQEHVELEKRYRELTDLLYYKQTQLESMASEKAAAEFQLEKEIRRSQDTQVEAERIRASRRTSSSWEEDSDLKALETLPLHHRHMVGASEQLKKAAKILDTGAVRATRFLWRYPTARVILLFYLVFVHLFLMYLLHRLQEQADNISSREVAESMGLIA